MSLISEHDNAANDVLEGSKLILRARNLLLEHDKIFVGALKNYEEYENISEELRLLSRRMAALASKI